MGSSLSSTHTIFFIVSLIVAGAISGVFIAVTTDVSVSISEKGDRLQDQFDIEFKIINDPNNVPTSGSNYIFYLKNIGSIKLSTSNQTFQIFIDGDIIDISNYNFTDSSIKPSEFTSIYAETSLSTGGHTLRVIGPQGIEEEFNFII